MDPNDFQQMMLLLVAGVGFGNLWLMLIYGKAKAVKTNLDLIGKMVEYQNSVLTRIHMDGTQQSGPPPMPNAAKGEINVR